MGTSELTASARALGAGLAQDSFSDTQQLAPLRNRASEGSTSFVKSFSESPVPWQILDDATIERATKEHKLIFLHIGYKACHHCRLMAQESFSNPECAAVLGESFVPVVVDRDARPDLDAIYMNYVQAVSNTGGWPLNLFLTPNLEPVFGGTYWPGPSSARRVNGDNGDEVLDFLVVIKKMRNIWRDQEARCRKEATEVLGQLREFTADGTLGTKSLGPTVSVGTPATPSGAAPRETTKKPVSNELDLDQLEEAYTHISGTYDPVYGGFGLAPKFLTPPKLEFLLKLSRWSGPVQDVVGEAECKHALAMALETLRQVGRGALRDHVGGHGFARCSVTPDWTIPNFDKLVSDNALLLSLYLQAWQQSGAKADSEFFDIVVELVDYLTSEPIALSSGGFASSETADSYYKRGDKETREGAYYLWTKREFDTVIEATVKDARPIVAAYFDVLEDGNVDEDHDPNDEFINQNILRVRRTPEDISKQFNITPANLEEIIRSARAALKTRRDKERVRPEIDDKIVTGVNGLVISALAKAGAALKDLLPEQSQACLSTAKKAVEFIREKLWDGEAKVLYRLWTGERSRQGFADDYAYLISGLLDLFEVIGDEEILEFADSLQSAFFSTTASSPHTILRLKDGMDTSLPSTNAVAVSNLFLLGSLLDDARYDALARETLDAFEVEVLQYPWLFPGLLAGVVTARLGLEKKTEVVDIKYKSTRQKA